MIFAEAAHALNPVDARSVLDAFGTAGVFAVLFAETGLLVGFFLPGDSLLFTAGLLSSTAVTSATHLSLPWVLVAAVAGALSGAQVGYLIGTRLGLGILDRAGNRHLRRGVERMARLLGRYGYGKTVVLARFVPVVRTVVNPLAGALGIPALTFTLWQVLGGTVWSVGLTVAGYALGSSVPGIDQYLLPAVAVVVVVSVLPIGFELLRSRHGPAPRGLPPGPGRGHRDG